MGVSRISFLRLSTLALTGLGLPAFAAAQHHGGMAGGAPVGHTGAVVGHAAPVMHATAVAPHMAARIHSGPVNGTSNANRFGVAGRMHTGVRHPRHVNNLNTVDTFGPGVGETSFDDVPGLGFDFPHLAAVSGQNHFGQEFFGAPFFGGGFLFGAPSVIIEQPAQAQPEDEDIAGSAGAEQTPVHRSPRMFEEPNPAPAASSEPQREVEQYVFVKRDGGLEFAVAYSWVNGMLRYITPEGKRRTMAPDALDLNATERFNEQRGIEFHAPA